jgi:Superfamily II DNA helicase
LAFDIKLGPRTEGLEVRGKVSERLRTAVARLSLTLMKGLGVTPEELLSYALRRQVRPTEISSLVRSLRSCPRDSVSISQELAGLGLYEDVIYMAHVLRCPVSTEAVVRSRAGLLALGEPKWEARAAALLGEAPRLSRLSLVMSAFCAGDEAEVYVDGVVVRVPPPEARWRSPPVHELLERIASLSGAEVLLSWGCDLRGFIDVKALAEVAFPDVEPTLPALMYALGVSPSASPPEAVLAIAKIAADVLARAGVEWRRLPETVREAWALALVHELPGLSSAPRAILVTDRPRALARLWRPFRLDLSKALDSAADYVTVASLTSLALRGGDPLRVLRQAPSLAHGRQLEMALRSSIVVNPEPPSPGDQVEPWDLRCLPGPVDVNEVEVDCVRPVKECLSAGPPADEVKLLKSLGVTCEASRDGAYEGLASKATAPKGKVKTIPLGAEGGLEALRSIAWTVKAMSQGRRLLVITPNRLLAKVLSRGSGSLSAGQELDSWLLRGGPLVLSLDEAYERPGVVAVAEAVLLLMPERYRSSSLDPDATLEELKSIAAERALRLGAYVLTRAWDPTDAMAEPFLVPSGQSEVHVTPDDLMEYAVELFRSSWGSSRLRPYQETSLRLLFEMAVGGPPSVEFVILPTGAGKSAIFQLAARALADAGLGSSALVVSPLRALMHDQVRGARGRGFLTSFIDSTVPEKRREEDVEKARRGFLDLIYVTPEAASSGAAGPLLDNERGLALVVLDEAHAVSRWGLSFRPSYLRLAEAVRNSRGKDGWPPIIALTASAPKDVVSDVLRALGFEGFEEVKVDLSHRRLEGISYRGVPVVLRAPALRPEIEVDIIPAPAGRERLRAVEDLVKELSSWADRVGRPWIGIVFVPFVESREAPWLNADYVARYLSSRLGVRVARYHGKLGDRERRLIEEAVIRASRGSARDPNIVVATKAFGMGVDIPNVRWTLHVMPSASVEDLYQEIGRAGRDGRPSRAVVLYNPSDVDFLLGLARHNVVRPSEVMSLLRSLRALSRLFPKGSPVPVPLSRDGSGTVDIRHLDVLRVSGLLDYEVAEGPLTFVDDKGACRGNGWHIPLRGRGCMVRADEGEPATVCIREDKASLGPANGDQCETLWTYRGPVALVYLEEAPDDEVLPPEAFAASLWLSRREVKKVTEVKEVIEEALAARSRAGPFAASEVIKRLMDSRLAQSFNMPRLAPRLGGVRTCSSLQECLDLAVDEVHGLAEAFGYDFVTLAATDSLVKAFVAKYVRLYGRVPQASARAYSRFLRYLREGDTDRLMDMGYLIVLARRRAELERLLRRLRDYPYYAAFLYEGGGRARERKGS